MHLRTLTAADVREAVPMDAAIDAVAGAYAELSAGKAQSPVRLSLAAPGGVSLFMPAYLEESKAMGTKVVSVFQGNLERGMPSIHGIVLLLDDETGIPKAIMDGTYLTALRTGAGAGVATRLLAREDSKVLVMFGAGAQAKTQVAAVRAVRGIEEVRIVDPSRDAAERMAEELAGVRAIVLDDPAAAVTGADVICTATTSRSPVFPAEAVAPGTHVNGIGSYTPEMQEVPPGLVQRAKVVVDARDAALEEAGDLIIPLREGLIDAAHLHAEIGEIVSGNATGRSDPTEITFFKSVGNAVQDVAVARLAVAAAEEKGLGGMIEL